MNIQWFRGHRAAVRMLSVVVPLLVSGILHFALGVVPNSAAAMVLVLLVVGSTATGDRLAGVLAGIAATVGFDFFLTVPYFQLRIDSVQDVLLAILLLLVGLAVSELASWGIRQSAVASQQANFVKGALESADLAAGSNDPADALARVAASIKELLGAEQVSFEYGEHDAAAAVINRDGTMRYKGRILDVELTGLPAGRYVYTAIPVVHQGAQVGYFRINNPTQDVRPGRDQLRVAVLQAGEWALRAASTQRERNRHDPVRVGRTLNRTP